MDTTQQPLTGPIKSTNNNYMYNYCKQKILSSTKHEELLSIIKILIPMDSLKDKLVEIIDNLHNTQPNQQNTDTKTTKNDNITDSTNTLKTLYLNSSSIAEIFPDHVLVNIIKYLPSEQFKSIPMLSVSFHAIMIRYPILYNNYKVVIDEIPMHYDTQYIKIVINHTKKSIYIKLAEMEICDGGTDNENMDNFDNNSLMFTASFDSKWGGLIPNFSMQNSLGPKIEHSNPFSVKFPWNYIPKWFLFGDKWSQTKNLLNLHTPIPDTTVPNFESINSDTSEMRNTVRDIWTRASANIVSLELENSSKHFIAELPLHFRKLNHLKLKGILSHLSCVKSVNISRFPYIRYLEFHKIEIDASSHEMINFIKSEKMRYQKCDIKFRASNSDEMTEFMSIRARINYKYKIINDILSHFKNENLLVFKYYSDGSAINSIEMDLCNANNDSLNMDKYNVNFVKKLRQTNGTISFPKSLEFISLINCDCLFDLRECNSVIGLNVYGINYLQIKEWPNKAMLQCLICSTQTEITQDWNNIFIQKLPIKFIKRITNRTLESPLEGAFSMQRSDSTLSKKSNKSSNATEIYVENKLFKTMSIDMNALVAEPLHKIQSGKSFVIDVFEEYKKLRFVKTEKELMCLEIEDEKEIFFRLMSVVCDGNEECFQNKIEIYRNWWKLKIGMWIKHIGKQIIPKSQRNVF